MLFAVARVQISLLLTYNIKLPYKQNKQNAGKKEGNRKQKKHYVGQPISKIDIPHLSAVAFTYFLDKIL